MDANKSNGRAAFGSRMGVILATAGSAVGLGNIWRFPYIVGESGGAAFILLYISCILILGLPAMISELYIGRATQKNAAGAFKELAPKTGWSIIGYNGIISCTLILGFYSVIAGWTLKYLLSAIQGDIAGKTAAEFQEEFTLFSTDIVSPIIGSAVFILMTHIIIAMGVEKGIEKASKFMMPLLFLLLIILSFRSLTMDGAEEGVKFLFNPDFSKIDSSAILNAIGQAFFSLSIGMGCLITYASYFSKETNLQKTAIEVAFLDTLVAILAGLMIFPAVFSFGIEPTAGPELVFITLPNIFGQMAGGSTWATIFFILLAVAALTSTISLHEVTTAYLHEEKNISRSKATLIVSLFTFALSAVCSLSIGVWKEYTIFGLSFFDLLDFLTAKILMPLGGMFVCLFIAHRVDKNILKQELTNKGTVPFYFFNTYVFLVRWVAPILISLIFINELNLI